MTTRIVDQGGTPSAPVVAVGASAGGIEALLRVVEDLPADLPAPVLVVVHLPRTGSATLPGVVERAGSLPASYARDGEALRPGRIYLAPADRHLTILDHTARVQPGARVNRSRPAIDPLFQSVASIDRAAVGVILSGSLDDGAAGLEAIARAGGIAIVQDPEDALYAGMPNAALELVPKARRLPASDIAGAIVDAVAAAMRVDASHTDFRAAREAHLADVDRDPSDPGTIGGHPSEYACPACGGVLWEVGGHGSDRFRCRVGHAYSPQSLLEAQRSTVEYGLWAATRALEEQAALARRLADRAETGGHPRSRDRFLRQAETAERQAVAVRAVLDAELDDRTLTTADASARLSDEDVA